MTEYPVGYTCEVVALRLDRYVMGTLSRADTLAVAEHLEACASCVERLAMLHVSTGYHPSRGEH
jgi:anti-sigma factor RsiW